MNDKWFDDENEDSYEYAKICCFEDAHRKAKGKVSPAKTMERLSKERSSRIEERRRRQKTESERRTAKIDCIAFWILSGTMIAWTIIVLGFWIQFDIGQKLF